MGNQEIRSAMSRVQDRGFDANELADYEARLWREQSPDALSGFESLLNSTNWESLAPLQAKIDVQKSGVDDDSKRYQDQAIDCWQTGFHNRQKLLENLKNGDFKQIVIPTNQASADFERSMQFKMMIFSALFFVRHQGGSEAMDDFLTFARKHVAKEPVEFTYNSELRQTLLADETTLARIAQGGQNTALLEATIARLLEASEKIAPSKLFSKKMGSFADDLTHMQLRRVVLRALDNGSDNLRELSVKLLLRWGLTRASAEDLLLAAQLQQKYKIDISSELQFICKQSEVYKKPILDAGDGQFNRIEENHIQSRVSFDRGSDRGHECDQIATDGAKYFIYCDERGFTRGAKTAKSGEWSCEFQTEDTSLKEMTMVCHQGFLLVRHKDAPNVPFVQFDKSTLKPSTDVEPFTVADGEEDYLKWTPLDTDYAENTEEGNRWHRASPMYSDGEWIYMMVQYKQKGFTSRIIRTVLEIYEFVDERTMKRIKEVTLYKNDQGEYYQGSKKSKENGGHLARGSMACNDQVLLWWTAHNFHVYELSTGIRKRKDHVNSTSYFSTFDNKEQWYYYLDAACYSWLKRVKIDGFKPRSLKKEVKELPELPIVFDAVKGEILTQIKEESKIIEEAGPEEEEKKEGEEAKPKPEKLVEKRDPRNDLFDMLTKQDEELLDRYEPKPEQKGRRKTDPIANIHEVCQAIILSKMSTDAQQMSYSVNHLGDKKLLGEEMIRYFKTPFAVSCSKSYLITLREALEEHIGKLEEGRVTTLKQSNVLNLLHLYQANIDCLTACRIEMKHILPEAELGKIHTFQYAQLDSIKLFEGQQQKSDEDLTEEEIFQLHLFAVAAKLNQKLEENLDAETRRQKLDNMERNLSKAMEDEMGPEAKIINRVMPLMSSKKALADIFAGDDEELEIARRIINQCTEYLATRVGSAVAQSLETKTFQHREVGIQKVIREFTKNFCQELMVAFGNQMLTILEKGHAKTDGELSQEEQATLKSLREAQERKKVLEPMLYNTFIVVSQNFKSLVQNITQQVAASSIWKWDDDANVKKFYDSISQLFNAEKSLPRITLMFNLMMAAHQPQVMWLDEVAEALKNCADGLNSYLLMYSDMPYRVQISLRKVDTYRKVVEESLRAITYTIGQVSYRLILLNKDESDEKKSLSKLNILQGGIEARFIPTLSQESRDQIEGSFKITEDAHLQKLASQSESQVILEAQDSLLSGILDSSKSQEKIELVFKVLQQGLLTKVPFCPFARLGGDAGLKLTRAAFAVMLKFAQNEECFLKLAESIDFTAKDIGDAEEGDQKVRSIVQVLKEQANDEYFSQLKQWEQASQMRRWTQKVKLNVSEKLTVEIEQQLRVEISEANPSKEPFTGSFNDEQRQTIDDRLNEKFDQQIEAKYEEVIKKALFLVRLAVPQTFKDTKRRKLIENVGQGIIKTHLGGNNNLELFRNRSQVAGLPAGLPGLGQNQSLVRRKSTLRRGSVNSNDGQKMQKLGSNVNKQKTLLLNDGSISQKDKEVDWSDRLKQWRSRQQTSGAVTNFDEQLQQQSQSTTLSVLGCLQASFNAGELQERVEQSLVNGLRRSAGLHLLNFAMNLSYNTTRFLDLIQWLQGALRNNRMQTTHYLTGLEGCGIKAESGIRQQFFKIIERVIHALKHEELNSATHYVHLLNALCWNFTREDHQHLIWLDVFRTLQRGDGTIMHPIFRSWGQEDSNFSLMLEKRDSFSLQSRLRQVFEFLVQTVLQSLFVKKQEEQLDLGGEDSQSKMLTKQESVDANASEKILKTICEILFANSDRYLRMKMLFPKDNEVVGSFERFEKELEESDSQFAIKDRCPRDLAEYINKHGGPRIFAANRAIETYKRELKTQQFIARVIQGDGIVEGSDLDEQTKMIASEAGLVGALRSKASLKSLIQNRDYRVVQAIKNASWESLGLEEPTLSMEEKSGVTGISVEEYKRIAAATIKANKEAEKSHEQGEEEQKPAEPQPETQSAPTEPWNCGACTMANQASNTTCEVCSTPRVVDADPASRSQAESEPTQWHCNACTFINPISAPKCAICESPKSAAVPAESDDQSAQQQKLDQADREAQESAAAQAETLSIRSGEAAEEEKKDEVPEKTQAEIQEEQEQVVREISDPKTRFSSYLSFIQGIEPANHDKEGDSSLRLEGTMYTETSIFRVIRMLDQLIILSEESAEGFHIVQHFINPKNLKHLIELSVEASVQNQILIQRTLQQVLSLDLPRQVLDEAVTLAKVPVNSKDRANGVQKLLSRKSCLDLEKSPFLQFLFNRLDKSRQALYRANKAEKQGMTSVVQETMRTIRTLYTDAEKNSELRSLVNEAFTEALLGIESMSESEIDAVMTLIPEAAFQRMAIGSACVNKEGKIFNVLGVMRTQQETNLAHETEFFPNFTAEVQALSMAGIYYDPENPSRQDLIKEKMIYARPLLDLDEEQTEAAARTSIFMEPASLEQLIEIAMQEESSFAKGQVRRAMSLLKTFIVRGLYNMTLILKGEYIEFLKQFDLLANFFKFLLDVGNKMSAAPDEPLVSSLLLELRADYLRELTSASNKLTFGEESKASAGANINTSNNGLQLFVSSSQSPSDMFYFKAEMEFGVNEGSSFEGALCDSDPTNNAQGIFVIPSPKLQELSEPTLQMINYAKVVITDKGADFDELMRALKNKVLLNHDKWHRTVQTRFIVLASVEETKKILAVMRSGSEIKNTEIQDRAHFLGMVLKNISQDIWDKVDKDLFAKKFMNIDADVSFEEVSTVQSSQVLAELIEQKFGEEESFMQQIAMGETFEKLRSGQLDAGEEVKAEEEEISLAKADSVMSVSAEAVQEIAQCTQIPNFTAVLTQTEKLSNSVAEGFFNCGEPERLDQEAFVENFKHTIFSDKGIAPTEISKTYQTLLKTLRQSYSRSILLNIMSTAAESLDEQSKELVSQQISFAKLCDLIHNDYMSASQVGKYHGNPQMLEQSQEQISALLTFMKDVPNFASYFVNDLLHRGKLTLERAATDDFDKLDEFTLKTLRKAMEGSPMLDPLCLIFFHEMVFKLELVPADKLPEMIAAFFDLVLGFALLFKKQVDYFMGLDLLKMAKKMLTRLSDNLSSFVGKSELLEGLFSSKLIQCLTINMDCEGGDTLNARQKLTLEMIVQLVKLQARFKSDFNTDVPLGFEQSVSVRKALQIFKLVEEGMSFKTFIGSLRFKAILQSSDAKKLFHIARNYQTDAKKYDCVFKKVVKATDKDLVIKVDNMTSNDLVKISNEQNMVLADAGSFKAGRQLQLIVAKGTEAEIEFPVYPQIVNMGGQLYCRRESYTVEHSDAITAMADTAQCAAVQVCAMHQSVFYVGGDGSIWGMGFRTQGDGEDKVKLRRIEAPEAMRNIKKVAHGKFFRLVLTEEGRLFYSGQTRRYMMGSNMNRDDHNQHFYEVTTTNFFRLEDGDKIIDCCGGKCYQAVATQHGKVYASGYTFYRQFSACRHNPENNEDYPFELRLPEGWKAKQVFGAEKHYNIWVNATNAHGETKTFSAGDRSGLVGRDSNSMNEFKPVAIPDGSHLVKVTNQGQRVHGVDNLGNLWVWGSFYGSSDEERNELYEGDHTDVEKPNLVKYFKKSGLKCLDVASGRYACLVKTEDKDGKIEFYGMSQDEDEVKNLGGAGSVTPIYKHLLGKIEIEGSRVKDFAMGMKSSYFLMAGIEKEFKSNDPEHPEAKGLIHFYQEQTDAGKRWKFVTQEQYEAQKDSLPDVCFATHHTIKSLLGRVRRERAGHATQADLEDDSLPDLTSLIAQMDFQQGAQSHGVQTTNSDADVGAAAPLYYSFSQVNGQDQKVFATESEASTGEEAWDMNPLIYYRVKRPAASLDKLPAIDLSRHFTQSSEPNALSFTVMDAQVNNSEIQAIEISDPKTLEFFQAITDFSPAQDSEILKQLDQLMSVKGSPIEDCKSVMFPIDQAKLPNGSSLAALDNRVLQTRAKLLFKFSKAFKRAVKYVSVEDRQNEGSISNYHYNCKHLVVASVINQIVDKGLTGLDNGGTPEINVNRRKAFEFVEAGNVDHEGKYSIFGQIVQQLKEKCPDMSNFRHSGVDDRAYRINFKGEGSIDVGGPFRDSLVNLAQEIEDGVLPICIKSPNNRNDHGTNRDCFIINPSSTSPAHLEMYRYMGAFIAFGILSKSPVPFNLAPTVWKQILGERMTLSDLETIDAYSSQVLTDLKNYGQSLTEEEFATTVDQNFTTVLSDGEEVELCANGQAKQVTKDNIDEFIGLVLKARFSEATEQNKAIQEGIDKVFQGKLGLISYLTPDAIEIRACGAKEISVELLKSITSYQSCDANHEIVQRFWRVFEGFTHAQRSNYLKFVWGRNRLPVDLSRLSRKHEVRLYANMNEEAYPLAHTCFFQLDIPFYRTDEMCARRLIQASELCGSVDTDNNNFADE